MLHCYRYLFLWSSFDPGDDDDDNNIINCRTLTGQATHISLINWVELLYEDDGNQELPSTTVIGSGAEILFLLHPDNDSVLMPTNRAT